MTFPILDREEFWEVVHRVLCPLMERDEFDAMWEANQRDKERRALH